jgi:ribosomal protein L37AE/L43A
MCWGITTGDGWYDIIDNLCAKIQKICDNKPYQTEASQVKEKFGGLRFYTDHSSEEIEKLIEKAEQESLETCENCGSTKNVKQTTGWIYTLCEKCLTKRKKDDK